MRAQDTRSKLIEDGPEGRGRGSKTVVPRGRGFSARSSGFRRGDRCHGKWSGGSEPRRPADERARGPDERTVLVGVLPSEIQ